MNDISMTNLGPSLEDLLSSQKPSDNDTATTKLQDKMEEIRIKEKEQEVEAQASLAGMQYINLVGFPIGPDTLTLLPQERSEQLKTVCFLNNGQEIRLGTTQYTNEVKALEAEIAENWHAHVSTYIISEHSFQHAIKIYDSLPKVRKRVAGIEITETELANYRKEIKTFKDLDAKVQKTSITELVTLVIAGAIQSRSSDIHIEAEEKNIKLRYRIDGVLNDVATLKKEVWAQVAARLKGLAKLKINITDRPQDGRFSIYLTKDRVDVRVSALPTAFGESIVIRLLMSSATQLSFDDLGLRGQAFKILSREIERPNGMIITTGPTGSGKTTTLYAILRKLNDSETKIITIEDPIEYELEGINQSQTNDNYTFAKGLRSIVRQDPDVIMVGEIRDLETAEIGIQAALTGHLVLSTIHTNDAFGTIPRFLSMGAKPFLLAPALNVAIGQRLVRRVCEHCKTDDTLDEETMTRVKDLLSKIPESAGEKFDLNNLKFIKGQGCEECQGLGYKGRIGIYEIMPITGEIEKTITQGNLSEFDIKQIAMNNGIITMAQDGLLKALDGVTSVEEVFRVAE
jgi:type II secretory ATPase GspE/PulE/Tfp pilus assembly ATPase PilB-like protein